MLRKWLLPILTFAVVLGSVEAFGAEASPGKDEIANLISGLEWAIANRAPAPQLKSVRDRAIQLASRFTKSGQAETAAAITQQVAAPLDGILQMTEGLEKCGLGFASSNISERLSQGFSICNGELHLISPQLQKFAESLSMLSGQSRPLKEELKDAELLRNETIQQIRLQSISLYYETFVSYSGDLPKDPDAAIRAITGKGSIPALDKALKQRIALISEVAPSGDERNAIISEKLGDLRRDVRDLRELTWEASKYNEAEYSVKSSENPLYGGRRSKPMLDFEHPDTQDRFDPLERDKKNLAFQFAVPEPDGSLTHPMRHFLGDPDENRRRPFSPINIRGDLAGSFSSIPYWTREKYKSSPDPERLKALETEFRREMEVLFPGHGTELSQETLKRYESVLQTLGRPTKPETIGKLFMETFDSLKVENQEGVKLPASEWIKTRAAAARANLQAHQEEFEYRNPVSWQKEFKDAVGPGYQTTPEIEDFQAGLKSYYSGTKKLLEELESYQKGDPAKHLKHLFERSPDAVIWALSEHPEFLALICQLWKEMPEDQKRAATIKKWRDGATTTVAVGAGVLLAASPFIELSPFLLGAAGVGGTAAMGTKIGANVWDGWTLRAEATKAKAFLLALNQGKPEDAERLFDQANAYFAEAILDGAITVTAAGGALLLRSIASSSTLLAEAASSKDAAIAVARRLLSKVSIEPVQGAAKFVSRVKDLKLIKAYREKGVRRLFVKERPENLPPDSIKAIWTDSQAGVSTKVFHSLDHLPEKYVWKPLEERIFRATGEVFTAPVKLPLNGGTPIFVGLSVLKNKKKKAGKDRHLNERLQDQEMSDILQRLEKGDITQEQAKTLVEERESALRELFKISRSAVQNPGSFQYRDIWKDIVGEVTPNDKGELVHVPGRLEAAYPDMKYYLNIPGEKSIWNEDERAREKAKEKPGAVIQTVTYTRGKLENRVVKGPLENEKREILENRTVLVLRRKNIDRWFPEKGKEPQILDSETRDVQELTQGRYTKKVFERLQEISSRTKESGKRSMSHDDFVFYFKDYLDQAATLRDINIQGFNRTEIYPDGKTVVIDERELERRALQQLEAEFGK